MRFSSRQQTNKTSIDSYFGSSPAGSHTADMLINSNSVVGIRDYIEQIDAGFKEEKRTSNGSGSGDVNILADGTMFSSGPHSSSSGVTYKKTLAKAATTMRYVLFC